MNKWKQLEEQLSGVFGSATIRAGGHKVTFRKQLDGEKLVIRVGVDGWIKGAWMSVDEHGHPEHPEGRFYRPHRYRACKLKSYPSLKKVFGKKQADEMTALRTVQVSPYWNSPRTLISHLKKHFPDMELVSSEVAS
ncbi:hypothetical protein LCGC14_0074790 [marine sediment metagenome]|uniref:Uncharacterized protein n=1 Tax=marine sediment metagenome TaxID=412755 RepID=A0A0F9W0T1_9ZZZZ|nr:hypothetical protein [Halomonas sp.]HDZ48754.1 hypothetical protein [Halomonas sp.]